MSPVTCLGRTMAPRRFCFRELWIGSPIAMPWAFSLSAYSPYLSRGCRTSVSLSLDETLRQVLYQSSQALLESNSREAYWTCVPRLQKPRYASYRYESAAERG